MHAMICIYNVQPYISKRHISINITSIAFDFYHTDLAPSSLGLYEKPQAILSRTDLALG